MCDEQNRKVRIDLMGNFDSPERLAERVTDLMSGNKPKFISDYIKWLTECFILMGWTSAEGLQKVQAKHSPWSQYFTNRLTPEEAICEYRNRYNSKK